MTFSQWCKAILRPSWCWQLPSLTGSKKWILWSNCMTKFYRTKSKASHLQIVATVKTQELSLGKITCPCKRGPRLASISWSQVRQNVWTCSTSSAVFLGEFHHTSWSTCGMTTCRNLKPWRSYRSLTQALTPRLWSHPSWQPMSKIRSSLKTREDTWRSSVSITSTCF